MYIYHLCDKESKNSYNGKLSKQHLSSLIQRYELKSIGPYKEYCINTVEISSRDNQLFFHSVHDTEIVYDTGWIRQECDKTEIPPFHFYTVDSEETCFLYESKSQQHLLQLREYDDYILWTIQTPNILSRSDMKLFYI